MFPVVEVLQVVRLLAPVETPKSLENSYLDLSISTRPVTTATTT